MLTPARPAMSRVEAPANPLVANTSSAAPRMRALVEAGAARTFCKVERFTFLPRSRCPHPSCDTPTGTASPHAPRMTMTIGLKGSTCSLSRQRCAQRREIQGVAKQSNAESKRPLRCPRGRRLHTFSRTRNVSVRGPFRTANVGRVLLPRNAFWEHAEASPRTAKAVTLKVCESIHSVAVLN